MANVPGVEAQEMHRCRERGFCCGAGGARMWMEENIGKRINNERIDEALSTNPDTVSTACPFCLVMLGDAINEKKGGGGAKESLEVVDVSQLLMRSVKRPDTPEVDRPNGHGPNGGGASGGGASGRGASGGGGSGDGPDPSSSN